MKNDCIEHGKLFAFSQEMLSGSDQHQVKSHLERCESCRAVFQAYQKVDAVLNEWSPVAEWSPWFDARLRAALVREQERRSRGFLGLNWARWMAAPALASLLLVAGVMVLLNGQLARHPQRGGMTAHAVPVKTVEMPVAPGQAASQELKMYQNLPVLEDYDMLTNFDVISELPQGSHKIAD